ncbi:uncharacterized protein LOC131880831 [Tigriopus californicus]|uniref:uncharacterized protein LOC131880831 n=1 Tax=Tigriopus californicus TaxID=6832 RepID=UPI0027DA5CAB|nr:uncharacterized protein LOC131880831 [Tigriopus californicus]
MSIAEARCSPPSLVLSLSPGLGPDGLPSPGNFPAGASAGASGALGFAPPSNSGLHPHHHHHHPHHHLMGASGHHHHHPTSRSRASPNDLLSFAMSATTEFSGLLSPRLRRTSLHEEDVDIKPDIKRELESPTPKRQRLSPPTLEMLDQLHQHCVSPPIIMRRGNRHPFWHSPQEPRCHTPSQGRGNGSRRSPTNNPNRRSPPQLRRSMRQRERSGCDHRDVSLPPFSVGGHPNHGLAPHPTQISHLGTTHLLPNHSNNGNRQYNPLQCHQFPQAAFMSAAGASASATLSTSGPPISMGPSMSSRISGNGRGHPISGPPPSGGFHNQSVFNTASSNPFVGSHHPCGYPMSANAPPRE